VAKTPHGGKVPKPRKPIKRATTKDVLIIDDIDDALRRIWQRKKLKKPAGR
jgi:hypoxanthine phosphoribosyltransferase